MAARELTLIVIDLIPIPGGATIAHVLFAIHDLCTGLGDIKATYLSLYDRLARICTELKKMNSLQNATIDKYKRTLSEYYTLLASFRDMNVAQRLLHHRKHKKAIASINDDVNGLLEVVQLAHWVHNIDWKKEYDDNMLKQQQQLEDMVTNAAKLQDELRSANDKLDALMVLQAAAKRLDNLPLETRAVVEKAFNNVAYISSSSVREMPKWFLNETDVEFDLVPFAIGACSTVHNGVLRRGDVAKRVVVKMVVTNDSNLDFKTQQDFLKEANIWWKLRHDHIVPLLGACDVSNRPFLVCELAENGDMAAFLAKNADNYRHMWKLLHEAALGIQYLHTNMIIHGDVRLSNILVTADVKALVTDFGMSRIKQNPNSKSLTKRQDGEKVEGLARWLAPEVVDGALKPPIASDIYGLGMAMLEAATGEPPFADVVDEKAVKTKVRNGELPPKPAAISQHAWQLFLDMTKKDIHQRISIDEVLKRLGEIVNAESTPLTTKSATSSLTLADVKQLLMDLKNDANDVAAAMRLTRLTEKPVNTELFLTGKTIAEVIALLQKKTHADFQAHMANALANLAQTSAGAELIGESGGVRMIVGLLSPSAEDIRRSVQRALELLLKDSLNSMMFVRAGGITSVEKLLGSGVGETSLAETLGFVYKLIRSSSVEIARAVAANKSIVHTCLKYATEGAPNERDAAARVLHALAASDPMAVRAIDNVLGFETLAKRVNSDNRLAGETLVAAIKTLLRGGHSSEEVSAPKAPIA